MPLNSDAQGFLIGNKIALSGFGSEMEGLKNDVRSIRKSLMGRGGRDAVATPNRSSFATPNRRGWSSRDIVEPTGRSAHSVRAVARRVPGAATEALDGVVNTESDASVKALSEIAMPLKRGWAALRGGGTGERQEGWLKRIFGALRGNKDGDAGESTHFERSRSHSAAASNWGGSGGAGGAGRPGWGGGTGREMSLQAIEAHLKSIDSKTKKPEGFSVLGMAMSVIKLFPAVVEFMRQMRMDSNLDKIEKNTGLHYRVAFPFYAYARKRLKEMGELEEAPEHKGGGFLAFLFAPLLALLGGLIAKLTALPLIGPILGRLARMLGIPLGAGAAARVASGAGVGAGRGAPAVWGRNQDGIRGNRAARTARVGMRNAGRFMRPAGAFLKKVPVIGSLIALGLGIAGSSSIEKDEALTRNQKNAAEGKNWGGVAGGLGGAAAGAALGTVLLPGIGTVVGAVLGAVLGEWLGGNLGEMLGDKFSAFMVPISAGFAEIKLWALATWDWIRDGATSFYDGAGKVFAGVGEFISEKWEALTDLGKSVFDRFATAINAIYEGLKGSKIFGPLIRAAEATAAAAAAVARNAADGAIEGAKAGASAAVDTAKGVTQAGMEWAANTNVGRNKAKREKWESARSDLVSAARGAGVDPGIMAKIAGYESGYDPTAKAKSSTAHGYGQFLDGTWTDTLNRHGAKYAVPGAGSLTKAQALTHRGNTQLQAQMLAEFTRENIAKGRKLGGQDDDANVYAFHNLGDGDAAKFMRGMRQNPNAPVNSVLSAKVISNNPDLYAGGKISFADAYGRMGSRMRAHDWAAVDARGAPSFAGVGARVDSSYLTAATSPAVAPVVATTKTPAPPPPPPPPPVIAEAPQVQTQLGSGGTNKPITVQVAGTDAGQDVGDRGIAHIVTGGLARA